MTSFTGRILKMKCKEKKGRKDDFTLLCKFEIITNCYLKLLCNLTILAGERDHL